MPSTFTGLLVLVISLAPGLIYLTFAEPRGRPRREISAFRESAQVVLASTLSLSVSVLGLAVLNGLIPGMPPSWAEVVRDPGRYAQANPNEVLVMPAAVVGMACVVAYLWGVHGVTHRLAGRVRSHKLGARLSPPPDRLQASAWWTVLSDEALLPDYYRHLELTLNNGDRVHGWLYSFNANVEETGDRQIVLSAPIFVVTGDDVEEREGVAAISARDILAMHVSYHSSPPSSDI